MLEKKCFAFFFLSSTLYGDQIIVYMHLKSSNNDMTRNTVETTNFFLHFIQLFKAVQFLEI